MNRIAETIKSNDLQAYQAERYPGTPDGEDLVFTGEDFADTDFANFSMGFTVFEKCNLDRAKNLYGQPITLTDCSAISIDLRGLALVIHAARTDFSQMKYDDETVLAKPENNSPSTFVNCTIDPDAIEHFKAQGVVFVEE